ncbi:hypothetical protein PGB90_009542 [Kerria lacca]
MKRNAMKKYVKNSSDVSVTSDSFNATILSKILSLIQSRTKHMLTGNIIKEVSLEKKFIQI